MTMIRITRVKERKDGSATIEFTYTKDFAETVRKYYNKKRVTKKMIQKFVRQSLINYANEHSRDCPKDLEKGIK